MEFLRALRERGLEEKWPEAHQDDPRLAWMEKYTISGKSLYMPRP
jgi:hypothetical protein